MLAAREAGFAQVRALVVSDIDMPLPSKPGKWDKVHTVSASALDCLPIPMRQRVSRIVKFRSYQKEFFRPLGSFLGGQGFWFDSLSTLSRHMYDVVGDEPTHLGQYFQSRVTVLNGHQAAPRAN
jgi:hypothetical protein